MPYAHTLIFTDLDGTLLDHQTYSWKAAQEALQLAKVQAIPVIPCTSKTLAEVIELAQDIDLEGPVVFENGSGIALPKQLFASAPVLLEQGANSPKLSETQQHWLLAFAETYDKLCSFLKQLRQQQGFKFTGFNDMTVEDVMAATGLQANKAEQAKNRLHGEPLLWHDSESALSEFEQALASKGYSLTQGGRFYHVMQQVSKGKAMNWLAELYRKDALGPKPQLIALGDSYNDLPMLAAADSAVIVLNPSKEPLPYSIQNSTQANQTLIRTEEAGPAGWNAAILQLLKTETTHG